MITITEKAAQQIKSLMAKAPEGAQGVRLSIKTTGCSGNSYNMDYMKSDDDQSLDDIFEEHGIKLNIPKMYSWMLIGTTVDFIVDELGNSRFDFVNPNEAGRCGCGESFNVDVNKLKPADIEKQDAQKSDA
ncbi:MAG: HesB/IscA family protein [Bdellovibrionales bacterium]